MNLNHTIETLNGYLFSDYTVYALLVTGVIFTIWSGFGQYRALTHGISVVRGKYDSKDDPGAINHFQALSAALSATVGLGNIGGVALAVALGGPGAVLWMWIIGLLGMALKMTEVTQSMLYRNTDDPENPHGGPMFVVKKGFAKWGLGPIGSVIGGIFVVTLLISALTGGNMFQAWNVADITATYFEVPQIVTGIVLAVGVGLVIIGGIKRIGSVAGKIVPVMCIMYVAAALYVLVLNAGEIPSMLKLIVVSGLPGASPDASGAFLGGTFAYAAMWGVKRALFSSEAGQGSSPIAHSAAKTDEPVREGVVAGLEPFIDTIVVCTLTALVILSSGAYNRPAEAFPENDIAIVQATDVEGATIEGSWIPQTGDLPQKSTEAKRILMTPEGESGWRNGETVFVVVKASDDETVGVDENTGLNLHRITGTVTKNDDETWAVNWSAFESDTAPMFRTNEDGTIDNGIYADYAGASLTAHAFDRVTPGLGKVLVSIAAWLFALSTMISWSYYGEQGIYYLFGWLGDKSTKSAVIVYKLVYCGLILLTTIAATPIIAQADGTKKPLIGTDAELDMWTTLGLGVMLVANIPIMLIFGNQAMKAYHAYFKKMKAGGDPPHDAPSVVDVVEGKDVQ